MISTPKVHPLLPRTAYRLSLLAGLALGSMQCDRATAAQRSPGADAGVAQAPPLHVETADVTLVDTPVLLRLTGSLKGAKETDLAANASGRVLRTFVERGDEVKAGAVVAQLDTSAAALSLLEANVQVETSKTQESISQADCVRYEQLKAKGAISLLEYDQVTAKCKTAPLGLEAARARQNIAAKNVGDGTVRAPFPGVVSERYVEVGEYVQPASKVISLVQSTDLRLEFTVPEANLAQVKTGADVTFTVAAYGDRTFSGHVRYVSGAVRPATRDLVVEAVVSNPERLLRPGMFANVALQTGTTKCASVPLAAVFERHEKKRVYVVTGGRLEERIVQSGSQEGEGADARLAVFDGVKAGEKVAVGNLAKLVNGAQVQ